MKMFSSVYSMVPVTGLVTGLVLSSASVLVAGPIANPSFETGPLGQGGVIQNDWTYIVSSPSTGSTSPGASGSGWSYGPTHGGAFAVMRATGGSVRLRSEVFTIVNANATIQFDYWFEGDPASSIGQYTSTAGGSPIVFGLPSPTVSSGGAWQTLAPVAIPQGEWFLMFGMVNTTGTSFMGVDNINVLDNPAIPLPTGAAMAMVGLGVIGLRRRRD